MDCTPYQSNRTFIRIRAPDSPLMQRHSESLMSVMAIFQQNSFVPRNAHAKIVGSLRISAKREIANEPLEHT